MKENIVIFTDGSSRGNPGPGGWGAVIVTVTGKVVELSGREDMTTNNRMELSAAKEALEYIESRKVEGDIELYTDSAYLLGGVLGWMYGWEKNGWKTRTGEQVLNQDLWKDIGAVVFRLKQFKNIEWKKVAGHSGLLGNERADMLATKAADKEQQVLFNGALSSYEKLIGGSLFDGSSDEKIFLKKTKGAQAYSYVSMINNMIETHATWSECQARVKGKSGARFKKVLSKEEQDMLIEHWTQEHLS